MRRIVLLIACSVSLAAIAVAQPGYMNYQGRLLDPSGQPLTNGSYTLEFRIYESPNDTNLVWGPFFCDDGLGSGHAARAMIANGRFNVILGPQDTAGRPLANAFLEDDRFVEIRVNGGNPILPRQQVLSAPYALRAGVAANADQLNRLPPTDYFLPPGIVVPFAGPTNRIPAGWLLCDGRSVLTNNYPRLHAAIGTAWGGAGASFNLPDLRGMFLRGVNLGRGGGYGDPDSGTRAASAAGGQAGDTVGSVQDDALQNVSGTIGDFNEFAAFHGTPTGPFSKVENVYGSTGIGSGSADQYDRITMNLALAARTSSETRPNNAYVNYIIKY